MYITTGERANPNQQPERHCGPFVLPNSQRGPATEDGTEGATQAAKAADAPGSCLLCSGFDFLRLPVFCWDYGAVKMAKKVTDGENGARGQGLQIVRLSVADLSGDPANARKHDERKRGKKTVVCQGCGESRVVRVDTSPKLCRSCNARKSSKPGETRPQRVLGQCVQCEHCGNSYYRNRSEANKK